MCPFQSLVPQKPKLRTIVNLACRVHIVTEMMNNAYMVFHALISLTEH